MTDPGDDLVFALGSLNAEIGLVEMWMSAWARVRADVPMPSGGYLAWGKIDHTWQLLSVSADGVVGALTRTSIERRLESVAVMPALITEARHRQATTVDMVRAAVEALRAVRGG